MRTKASKRLEGSLSGFCCPRCCESPKGEHAELCEGVDGHVRCPKCSDYFYFRGERSADESLVV